MDFQVELQLDFQLELQLDFPVELQLGFPVELQPGFSCWFVVSTLITILPLRMPVWESLTLNSSQERTILTSYLPTRKRYMGCHPQTKQRRKTYAMTHSGLP